MHNSRAKIYIEKKEEEEEEEEEIIVLKKDSEISFVPESRVRNLHREEAKLARISFLEREYRVISRLPHGS